MTGAQDMELVKEFARQNSEAAFTELVRRHIALVYSVAQRYTGNAADAKDVTQAPSSVEVISHTPVASPPGCCAPIPAVNSVNRRRMCNLL